MNNYSDYSMQKISKKSGISVSAISLIIRGLRNAKVSTANKLEDASGIPSYMWRQPLNHQEDFKLLFTYQPFGFYIRKKSRKKS